MLELAGGPVIAPQNPRAINSPFPIVLHILSSFVFCIIGALQFMPNFRRAHIAKHRSVGRVVVVSGCASAVSGLWMTHVYDFPADLQASLLYFVRIVLGSLMVVFLLGAWVAIKARYVYHHSAFMMRAYAIGLGASTQTIVGVSWILIVGSEAVGSVREGLMISAWAANLLVAEALIRKFLILKRPPSRGWR